MFYKVIESFGPPCGAAWDEYRNWTHQKEMTSFDSIDSILRPNCFEPESDDDWKNCVNEDYKLNLLTSIRYALTIAERHPQSTIVGVECDIGPAHQARDGLLGYDIVDQWCNVSLITNWGTEGEFFARTHFQSNGLLGKLSEALDTRDALRDAYADDPHARNCQVWAIYKVAT